MIDFSVNKGKSKLCASGDVAELMVDVTYLVEKVYECLKSQNEGSARIFEQFIRDNKICDLVFNNTKSDNDDTSDETKEDDPKLDKLLKSLEHLEESLKALL